MELEGSEAAAQRASELLSFFRQQSLPIFHVQHISRRPGASFFLPDSFGAEIHSLVRPQEGEILVQKQFPNSFRDTDLLVRLKSQEVSRLVVAGMMTHMCVHAAVRAAVDYGLECRVVADACATRALQYGDRLVSAQDVQAAFLAALIGTYAKVFQTQDILRGRWD